VARDLGSRGEERDFGVDEYRFVERHDAHGMVLEHEFHAVRARTRHGDETFDRELPFLEDPEEFPPHHAGGADDDDVVEVHGCPLRAGRHRQLRIPA
jgi:hypothetical protein